MKTVTENDQNQQNQSPQSASVPNPFAEAVPENTQNTHQNQPAAPTGQASGGQGSAPPNIPTAPKAPQQAAPKPPTSKQQQEQKAPASKSPQASQKKQPLRAPRGQQQKKSAAPQNIPTPEPPERQAAPPVKQPAQQQKQSAPQKKQQRRQNPAPQQQQKKQESDAFSSGFADEVLKAKEAPRKNPRLNQEQSTQNVPPGTQNISAPPAFPTPPASEPPKQAALKPPAPKQQQAPAAPPNIPTPQSPAPPELPVSEPSAPQAASADTGQAPPDVPPVIDEVPPLQEVPAGVSGEDLLKSLSDSQVSGAERRALVYRIVTGLVVVGFLAAITFGAVFAYNRWVRPTLEGGGEVNTNTEAPANENVNTEPVDPATLDTDGDTLPDQWEVENGLDLNDGADGQDDPDFDQLKNVEEFRFGTNPQNPDTDADGFRDGAEVQQGYNPNGEGRLGDQNQNNASGQDFTAVEGNWTGTFNGANLFADDLEFKLDDEGEILGTYNFARQDGSRIFGQAKGTFAFTESTGQFTSDMNVKGFFEQESVDFTMKLTGQSQGAGRLSGTWTIVPAREVPWLSNDNGTFVINK